ncbi:hypothetical protein NG796_17105 [Laspinema sp. A4]|uniref:hypothetical protein n=1 Tax=Laspinema sp. D2d TaxID=2953686 RepID=UPI0021BB520A|nr:hypothetical protein [Laspinema sp. D2d]MCT7984993.1 hypothetical protein [Laspinema sp. D2d]
MNEQKIECKMGCWEHHPAPTSKVEIPSAYLLPMGIPPKLLSALQVENKPAKRYVILTYQATNCYVEHIYGGHTDSFWVYSALIDHFSVAIHLIGCDLGSDDSYPVYGLLLDQQEDQIWLGQYRHLKAFLKTWREYAYPEPVLTPEQREQIQKNVQKFYQELRQNPEKFPQLSAQEFGEIVQARMKRQEEAICAITQYLDQHISDALSLAERRLNAAKNNEDHQIIRYLDSLIYRLKHQQN